MKRVILILAITVVGIIMSFVDAYWGLLLYTWYSFASPLELTYGILLGSRLSLIVGGLVVLCTLYQRGSFSVAHPLTFLMYSFLCAAFFSLAVQMRFDFFTILEKIELLAKIVVISAMTPVLLTSLARIRGLIFTVGFSGGLLGWYYGMFGLFAGSVQIFGPGRIGDNNGYAVFLAALLPYVFFSLQHIPLGRMSIFRPVITAVVIGGNILAVVLTYSRGGFLAVSFVLLLLLSRVRSVLGRIIGWGFFLPMLLFAFWTIFTVNPNLIHVPNIAVSESPAMQIMDGYLSRLRTLRGEIDQESSAGGRLHFWKVAIEMTKANPVFGVGLGQYPHQYVNYDFSHGEYGDVRAVHNTPLLILSELGLFGFIVFSGMVLVLYIRLAKSKARLAEEEESPEISEYYSYIAALRISIAGFLLGGMFVNVPFQEIFWVTLSISIGIDRCSRLRRDALRK